MHAFLRGLDADDRGVRRLGVLTVRARGLAERRYIAQHVEQIVLNLERETDRRGEAGQRLVAAAGDPERRRPP